VSFILQSFGHADEAELIPEQPEIRFNVANMQNTFMPSLNQLSMQLQTGMEDVCIICNQSFKYKYSLLRHMKKHDTLSQLKCMYCGKVCYRQDHLDSHVRIHTGEKPFKCPLCDKAFSYKQGMVAHFYTHTVAGVSMNE
jgi:uncharacterized Zn-finger protein